MTGPHPAVAAARVAVRTVLAEVAPGGRALVACSGGADSLALAAAAAFEGPRAGVAVGAVVVDHGLQPGSDEVAQRAAAQCRSLGLAPVEVVAVRVGATAEGPEGAARSARYAALDAAAEGLGAAVVLLGHTLEDQAEQVLLGLLRGSGARSLSGMPARRGRYARPLLGLSRTQARQACAASGLEPWADPHNDDPAYARVRVRRLLGQLEDELGPGVAAALARTAGQLREDADLLDAQAEEAVAGVGGAPWSAEALLSLPRPLRTRVWRLLAVRAGAPAGSVSFTHVEACDALLTGWHGQGPVSLPGGVSASRSAGRVSVHRPSRVE
jgi:tRNA(Ile)-lysidine synthase